MLETLITLWQSASDLWQATIACSKLKCLPPAAPAIFFSVGVALNFAHAGVRSVREFGRSLIDDALEKATQELLSQAGNYHLDGNQQVVVCQDEQANELTRESLQNALDSNREAAHSETDAARKLARLSLWVTLPCGIVSLGLLFYVVLTQAAWAPGLAGLLGGLICLAPLAVTANFARWVLFTSVNRFEEAVVDNERQFRSEFEANQSIWEKYFGEQAAEAKHEIEEALKNLPQEPKKKTTLWEKIKRRWKCLW